MREDDLDCPNCRLKWQPARCDALFTLPDGAQEWKPGDYIRCVECKETYYRPIAQPPAEREGV